MSMVARTNPGPAEDDITDTDDGDTRISAGAFWPDIVLRELRLAVRLPGRVTTSRLLHTATGAIAHVTGHNGQGRPPGGRSGYTDIGFVA